MDGVLGKPLRLAALRELIELWCGHGDSGASAAPEAHGLARTVDVHVVYRQAMKTDLEMLNEGIVHRNIEQARRAAHRISGAAAVVDDLPTHNLASELERHLASSSGDITADIQALVAELQSLHGAGTAPA